MTDKTHHLRPGVLLTVQEVAEIVRMTESWVHKQVRRSRLPAIRLGRRILIHRADLGSFLDSHRVPLGPLSENASDYLDIDGALERLSVDPDPLT